MSEDVVLQNVINWFASLNSTLLYQTRPVAEGAIGGVDAILFCPHTNRFIFIDAKGAATKPVSRAASFSNSLGNLIKRIRFENGYTGNEAAERFIPLESRNRIATEARHRVSDYILALTPDYEQTVRMTLDPALASLLHIRVLFVETDLVRECVWMP